MKVVGSQPYHQCRGWESFSALETQLAAIDSSWWPLWSLHADQQHREHCLHFQLQPAQQRSQFDLMKTPQLSLWIQSHGCHCRSTSYSFDHKRTQQTASLCPVQLCQAFGLYHQWHCFHCVHCQHHGLYLCVFECKGNNYSRPHSQGKYTG